VADLTVVVPTRDRPELLDRCLYALRGELLAGDQLVVVDSGPATDPADPVAARWSADLVSLALPGASLARNEGWRVARHDLVAFVDDDVVVAPGWRAAMVGCDADFVLGRVEEHPDDDAVERPVSVVTGTEGHVVDRAGPLQPGIAGNLLVRRTFLERVAGFDVRLGPATWFSSAEDLDLFDRLVLSGAVGWYEPAALAWHVQWRTSPQALRLHWAYGKGMGARLSRLARADRRRAKALLPSVLRLGGIRTAAVEVSSGSKRAWGPPIVWRLGAIAGFVVGLLRLPSRPS
jgi:GT2 family glycosyltransferase